MATLVSRVVGVPTDGVGRVTVRTSSASSVRLKVGTDTAVTSGVIFGSSVTPNAQGDSQLTVSGLAATTQYYYRVEMIDSSGGGTQFDTGTVGKFRTAPAANTAASFAFDFASCATGESASMAAIAARNDDLFFHLGDLYYHDGTGTDITNFRNRMSARIQLANHQSVFSTMPMTYTPSDHDGMNNNGTYGSDPTAWTNWNQVYREMFPTPTLAGTMGVYYTFAWGRIRFIHIDTRSFKTIPSDTDNSSKTCLGVTQKQWLKDQITSATEPVIVILQDSPWIGSASAGDDAWLGYTTERSELATFFQNSGKNIGMMAGDMHALAADDGTNAPGGIFLFHASPLKGTSSIKGGPYSVSPYPSSAGVAADQYGRVVVTDSGSQISLAFTGYSSDDVARVSLTKTFTVSPPGTPPPTPANLAAVAASSSQINVSWNGSSGATGYDLEVDGIIVDKGVALTHQHTGLTANTSHNYRVRAKNTNGTSAWSSIVSATTQSSGGGYATITLTGTTTLVEQATSTGSITVTIPTGATVGEVLIAQIASTGSATIATPTGWTQISQANETSVSSAGFYRVVTGTESASYIWTGVGTSRSTGIMQRFTGVDTTTPLDVAAASATSPVTTSFIVPSITTVTAGAMLLNGIVMNASTTSQIVPPASMTATALTTGTGRRTTLAYESRPTAGATGTRTWTNTPSGSVQYGGWTVALRPASLGGSAPSTPTGLAAVAASSSQINISWNSIADATGYDLEVDGTIIDKGAALTHQHTGLTASTSHNYRVRAKNANGTSAWSSIVSATTQASAGGYATITLTGSLTLAEQATGDSLTVTVPAGAQIGEVLVAQIASTTNTVVGPAGWTQIAQANNAVYPISSNGYYRVVTGTESSTYTWTGMSTNRSTGIMQRFAGVDTTTPIDVAAATAVSVAADTTLTLPSITTVTNGAILIGGVTLSASTGAIIVAPSGMTALTQTTGTGRRSTLGYETRATAGATGTRVWTMDPTTTLRDFAGWHCALRPATVSTPPTPTGLAAVAASSSQINVSWNSSSGATGYDLEVDGVIVDKATALTHQHTGLTASTSHNYRVRAKNTNGTSAWSSIVSATTQASAGSTGITLTGTATLVEQATSTGSIAIPVPAGAQIGEILIAHIAATSNAVTTTAGWTLVAQANQTSAPISSNCYYRVVTGGESASYTWSDVGTGRSTGIMQRFAGVDTTTPIDVTAATDISGGATTFTLPSITTITPGALLLNGPVIFASNSTALAPPASMTEITSSTGTGRRTALAYESCPTAGATGVRTWSENPVTSALQWAGWTVALRPAASAPPTPTGLAAVAASSSQINVSWNSSSGATGYDLEVDGVIVDKATATTHQHTGLSANTSHNYRVRAKNAVGTSAWSSIISATTSGTSGAVALKGVGTPFSSAATTSYVLSTHSSTAIGDLLVATLTIDELASIVTVTPPSGWTVAFTPLESAGGSLTHAVYWRAAANAGTENHTFTLNIAYKGSGNIATFSGADTAAPFAGSITGQGTGDVSLSLPTPSANNCMIIAGTAVNHDAITYTYSTPAGWTNDWTITGQQASLFYHQPTLQTTATSASFASTISPANAQRWIGWIAAIKPPSAPATPTGLATIATGISSISVSWNSSAGATGYDLEVDSVVIDVGTAVSYSHTGLAGSSTHNYRIRAKNAVGASAWSSIVSGTTQAANPGGAGIVGLRGVGAAFNSAATTSFVLNTPSSTAIGDLLIATMTIDLTITSITAPSGWTASFATLQPGSGATYAAYWRFAVSAGATSHTFTLDIARKGSGNIAAFYGVDSTSPFAGLISTTGTTDVSMSLAAPTANNCLIIGSFGADHSGSTYGYSTPAGWINDWTLIGEQINLFYHQSSLQTTAAATSFTSTIGPTNALVWGGWLAAIRPAPTINRVIDIWSGSALVRRRLDRWNGAALINTTIDTNLP